VQGHGKPRKGKIREAEFILALITLEEKNLREQKAYYGGVTTFKIRTA